MQLRMFPLNTVLFPGAALSLHIFEPRYKQMIAECLDESEPFGVTLIRDGHEAGDPAVVPHHVGTTAEISEMRPLPEGRYFISTVGGRRFRIERVLKREPYLLCDVTFLDEGDAASASEELDAQVRAEFAEYLRLLVEFSGTQIAVDLPADPQAGSFSIGHALQVADAMKQRLLEAPSTHERLTMELAFLRKLLPQLRSLLERKRATAAKPSEAAPGGSSRAAQEKLFGKYFSSN
jgi:Lon protease-like protein